MGESLGHLGSRGKLIAQAIWAAGLAALIFVASYWIPVLVLEKVDNLPLKKDFLYIIFHLVVSIIYIFLTYMAERYPKVLARHNTTQMALGITVAGALLLFLVSHIVGQLALIFLIIGACLYLVGAYWLNITSCVSLSNMQDIPFVVGVSFAFPIARLIVILIYNIDILLMILLLIPLNIAIYAMSKRGSRRVLDAAMRSDSPYDLKVTNTRSFLPFTSKLFIALLLTAFLRIILSAGQEAVAQLNLPVFTYATPLVIAVYILAKHACPKPDVLFQASSFIMVLASILFLTFGGDASLVFIPFDLAGCGSGLAELGLYWYSIITLGTRNILATLPTLIWGRAALSIGSTIGSAVSACTNGMTPAGISGTIWCVSFAALLFVGYILIALKNFSFVELANSIQPISRPRSSSNQFPGPSSEAAMSYLANKYKLTPKELEVCSLLARGRNYLFIEDTLSIKRNTVKSHVRNIYGKLGIHSQQELIDIFDELR